MAVMSMADDGHSQCIQSSLRLVGPSDIGLVGELVCVMICSRSPQQWPEIAVCRLSSDVSTQRARLQTSEKTAIRLIEAIDGSDSDFRENPRAPVAWLALPAGLLRWRVH